MSQIEVISALPEDAYDIAVFSQKSFYESFADTNSKENMDKFMLNFSVPVLMEEVTSGLHTFFIAKQEGKIAGYIKLTTVQQPDEEVHHNALELARIYVDQKVLARGIGGMLMQRGLQFARDNGFELIWLGVWEHNYPAQAFYKKWGFERFSEHIFMLGDDPQNDWLMKRKV
jgi:diamine N-acetyltransferase